MTPRKIGSDREKEEEGNMAIRWLTQWLPWLPDRSEEAVLRGLPCVKKFRKTLARERARAERLGDGFSLLALGVNDWRSGRPTFWRTLREPFAGGSA